MDDEGYENYVIFATLEILDKGQIEKAKKFYYNEGFYQETD